MRVSVKKVAATVPKVVHAAKFVKDMTKNAEAEAKRKRKEEFQTAVVFKAVASIPACVKKKGEIAGKVRATIPKYVNGAKQIKTAAKIGSIVTCAAAKGIVKKEIRETKEEYRRLGEEVLGRAININEGMKRELDLYFQNVERGVTQKGAVRYYLMDWDPAFDALEMIFRMRRTVAEQLPGYGSAKESYEQIRGWVIKLGDNIGNSVYNKDIPFVSDFVGEAFHSSDREESGDSSNLASVSGAFVNGFVGTGALGTVDGIGGMIADPYGAAEGMVSMLANREEAYVMLKEAAMKAVDENLINGSWEDRSRAAGAVVFEVVTAIYSAGALSAAKAGDKAGDAGKASKLLNKVSDAGGEIKRGISKGAKKTLGGKAAKEAAEEAAEKADDILGDLARRMSGSGGDNLDDYSMVKGWLEEQGKSLEIMDEGGVNIHKAEDVLEDIEKVDGVLEGGEVLERGNKSLYDVNGKYTGGRSKAELNALEYDPAKKAITSGSQNEAKIGLDLESKGVIGRLERSADPKAEFIDSLTGKKYDVKSFESTPIGADGIPITSAKKGAFEVERAMKNIIKEFEKNGNDFVIINKSKLSQNHIDELIDAINSAGITDKIIWWPE